MADTASETQTTKSAPKATRKPRAAAAASTAKPASIEAPKAAKPRSTKAASAKRATSTATKTPTKRAPATRRTKSSTPARAAKAVKAVANDVAEAGTSRKKVAIGVAALAGVAAAGVAAILGRKKLVEGATEALEAVSGTTEDQPAASPAN